MSRTPPSAWALAYACGLWLAVAVTFPAVLLVARDDERSAARQSAVHADLRRYCDLLTAGDNAYVGTRQREYLLRELASPLVQSRFWTVTHQIALANDYLRFGETDQAVATLERALEQTGAGGAERNRRAKLLEALAVAHLKQGELANCLTPSGGLVCALPLDPSYVHGDRHGSTRAIARLRELLAIEPDNLKARWLLNVAHMTLGSYPDRVDPVYLVPRELLDPDIPFQRFSDVAPAAGLYRIDLAGGAIMDDFDNDGLLDVMSSSWHPCEPVSYHRNLGDGTFADHTERAGLAGQTGGLNMVQADYDNDGLTDVLIMRGGWLLEDGQMRMSLLRNTGGGFDDVTREAGLGPPDYPSQSAAWADYDGDGDLDLFSCNESMPDVGGGMKYPSQLYRNDGGHFTDVAESAGVTNLRYCKGSVWGDYNGDGAPDLYVSNFGHLNRLYRNEGGGRFVDVAPELGVAEPVRSFATWFWDYNNDGRLDLFVAGYGPNIADVAADYLGLPNDGARPRLYRNDGPRGFTDATRDAGLHRVHLTMGANFGDLDNDGFPDFYLGTGWPSFDAIGPNVMYRNVEGLRFEDVTFSGGFGHVQKGHAVAFGDYDRDGDQDLFAQMGGFYPGDAFANALYQNPGNANRWLSVRLSGTDSNRSAIGAAIRVAVETADGSRTVYAHVNSGGSFGGSSLEQEIGLGRATRVTSLSVRWPSGLEQFFESVPLDVQLEIVEGESEYRVLSP